MKVINAFQDLIDAKRIVREIKLLSKKFVYPEFFKHDNIIRLLDILKPQARTGYSDIYIITDLMETDLHRVIYSRQELSDDHIQYFVYQILRGLLFMHSANVIHRDLKPSNLLLVFQYLFRTKIVTCRYVTWVWREAMWRKKRKKPSMQ